MKMKDKTGGQAYPLNTNNVLDECEPGITKLDYFAAKAMQSFLIGDYSWTEKTLKMCAEEAYKVANAMLKEREKWV